MINAPLLSLQRYLRTVSLSCVCEYFVCHAKIRKEYMDSSTHPTTRLNRVDIDRQWFDLSSIAAAYVLALMHIIVCHTIDFHTKVHYRKSGGGV